MENVNSIDECRSKIVGNRVFDCHLSPDCRQMAIKISVKIECLIRFLCNRLQYDFKLSLVQ